MSTNTKCVSLHRAALKGDWESVKLRNYPPDVLKGKITDKGETALHISAAAEKFLFVESLVNFLKVASQLLEAENDNGNTALCYAAVSGDVSIATVMLEAYATEAGAVRVCTGYNPLANRGKVKPLLMAARFERCEMVKYLMGKTEIEAWSGEERVELFTNCINIGLCGEASEMLGKYKDLGTSQNKYNETGLLVLARKPCVFAPQNQTSWRSYIGLYEDDENSISDAIYLVKDLYRLSIQNPDLEEANRVKQVARALFVAAEKGNVDFIIELIRLDPDLVWKCSKGRGTIFHIAIQNRHEDIFNLLSELGSFQDLIATIMVDGDKNMLHLAAELAPREQLDKVSGAALQMQRELLWFKKVEKIVQPSYREMENSKHKTPHTLFIERHRTLMAEGEKWMKETAKSSMVVAALIATVMFTTAFTVPGGYNNDSGEPIFENERSFFIFSVADALALFCSSTSILMFLSILTSRYTETDFLESLPFRLMVGVTALFVSVAAMMVAFCATFFLYYPKEKVPWMFGVSAIFACVPSMYVSLKYPLLLDLVRSTHASRFMFQSRRQLF